MKILTWNINSVRLRLPLLLDVMARTDADVICLQETKTPDEFFPRAEIESAGYPYIHFTGMKGYNGVAILSRHPFSSPQVYPRCGQDDCRHISVTFDAPDAPHAFELHNIYIPAGGYEADPVINPKFQHKLDFVDELTRWFSSRYTDKTPLVAVGDFNIAPHEHDVWSHKQMLGVVSHTPEETQRLLAFQNSLNFTDAGRHFVPMDEKLYTWWSYRNHDWQKSNRGRRLDHIWVTPPLHDRLCEHETMRDARSFDRPSDHVPVMMRLSA